MEETVESCLVATGGNCLLFQQVSELEFGCLGKSGKLGHGAIEQATRGNVAAIPCPEAGYAGIPLPDYRNQPPAILQLVKDC